MKFSGIVTPFEKDKSGNTIQLSIVDDSFNKYIIIKDKNSMKLFDLVDKKISLSGEIIDYDINERPILLVKKVFTNIKNL